MGALGNTGLWVPKTNNSRSSWTQLQKIPSNVREGRQPRNGTALTILLFCGLEKFPGFIIHILAAVSEIVLSVTSLDPSIYNY